jgi:hypothetical protein
MVFSKNNWHDAGRNGRSYLLRCWQEVPPPNEGEPDAAFVWRFTLIPVDDPSKARGFACLEELSACVREELAAETNPPL